LCCRLATLIPNQSKIQSMMHVSLWVFIVTQLHRINLIDEAQKDPNARIYIHCTMGISRSSSVTIAIMMWLKKWTLAESLYYVAGRRHYIRPNKGFMNQLGKWEMKLYGVQQPSLQSNLLQDVMINPRFVTLCRYLNCLQLFSRALIMWTMK
jgi:protein-tyrosine phosphatase